MKHNENLFFRRLVLHYYNKGFKSFEIIKAIKSEYQDAAPSDSFIKRWRRRFACGQTSLEDDTKIGRPMKHEEGKYDDCIIKLMEEDPYISIKSISETVGFSETKTRNYIIKNLGLKKKMHKWVPYTLTEEQKKERVIFCENFLNRFNKGNNIYNIITGDETWLRFWDPKKGNNGKVWHINENLKTESCKKSIKDQKIMVSVFFSKSGINSITILNQKEKANATWYKDKCLNSTFCEWKKSHQKCGYEKIILHHDNAPIHKSVITKEYLEEKKIKTLKHPPYSPDLSPCDFWLFPTIKQRMRGINNYTRDEIILRFKEELKQLEAKDFHKCFDTLIGLRDVEMLF